MEKALFIVPIDYERIGGIRLPVTQYKKALDDIVICHIRTLSYHPSKKDIAVVFSNSDEYSYLMVYGLNQAYAVSRFLQRSNTRFRKTFALLIDSEKLYASSVLSYINPVSSGKRYIRTLGQKILYGKKEKWCLANYTDVLYVSRVDVEYVNSNYQNIKAKVHTIENGIDAPELISIRSHDFRRLKIGFLSTYSFGVINENLKPLVEKVMPDVVRNHPEVKLVVAGRGEEEYLKEYLSRFSFVEYKGSVESLDLFYNEVDIIVPLTLKRNGILNKILEAWAYGKCVVGYDYNFYAFKEAIDGKHYLCGNSIMDVIDRIIDIIELRCDIDEIGQNARRLVMDKYAWESRRQYFKNIILDNGY